VDRVRLAPALVVAVCCALVSCVVVPDERVPSGGAPLTFRDLRPWFRVEGGGCEVAWAGDDEVTLTGGPGAIVVALADDAYRVHVEANVERGGNSGVFLRAKGGVWFPDGAEVQIDPADPHNPTGSLYGKARSAAPIPPADTWFTIDAAVRGAHVEAEINGVPAFAVDDEPARGPLFGLQAHYPGSVVHFRGLRIESTPR
jgi:hypothetical protein